MTDKNERIVESVDNNGDPVKVRVVAPTAEHFRDSQLVYNKAFRAALDSGALLRQKLNDYMVKQGIWDDDKDATDDTELTGNHWCLQSPQNPKLLSRTASSQPPPSPYTSSPK